MAHLDDVVLDDGVVLGIMVERFPSDVHESSLAPETVRRKSPVPQVGAVHDLNRRLAVVFRERLGEGCLDLVRGWHQK